MDNFGLIPEICWNSFEEQTQFDQETNAMEQLIEGQFFGYDNVREQQSSGLMSMLWPYNNEASSYCYLGEPNTNYEGINYYALEDEQLASSFFHVDAGGNPFEGFVGPNEVNSDESTECNVVTELELENWRKIEADECNVDEVPPERLKKKGRVHKAVKNSRSKKKQKGSSGGSDEEESNAGVNVQSTSSYSSEEDYLNASQEIMSSGMKESTSLNLNGKARAGRGAATDPQSLYARKRRERINERLRILQNLVPNGTKVDISTMLEEAVEYVKFLQLQIKLLSSNELWMFAPLAYNGMNLGLDLLIPTNKL